MVDLTDDMLRELVRLAGKATPGPWDTDEPNIVYSMAGGGCVYLANTEGLDTSAQQCRDDASFIEAADPPTVAALASELLKLREAVEPFAAIKAGEAVPVGWMLVPVEPTEAMCSADAGTATTDRLAWNRAMYRAMIAASPQPEAYGVRVKPLEWREEAKHWLRASSVLGAYSITEYSGMRSEGFKLEYGGGLTSYFNNLDEAKAAAQADYSARILAALSHTEQGETP
jgi:hypothetical protein